MPFKKIDIEKCIETNREKSPAFKKEWDESREEYRLLGEMVALRKKEKITQQSLADATGLKQQVISRVEKHEHSPSLRLFCKLLNALGCELRIVKKKQ
jgi:DNA-binding XRE family transcriptional regulator